MIETSHPDLSLVRQCALIGISRSVWYYEPKGESELNLRLMRLIDEQYLRTPWYGSRQMARHLRRLGHGVGRKRVRRLMRVIGLRSVAPQPNTSRRAPGHKVYPYLLAELDVERPNQVWCADLTFIPMAHGFLYLVAVMDWHSRKVLSWRLSTTQDAACCVEALEEALERYGRPEIFNSDQGLPVHERGLHRRAPSPRRPDLHGRQGPVDRQRIHLAAVAVAEIRMRLSERLRELQGRSATDSFLDGLLQRRTASFPVGRPHPE